MKIDDTDHPVNRCHRRRLRVKRGLLLILVLGAALLAIHSATGCATTGSDIQNPPPAVRFAEK